MARALSLARPTDKRPLGGVSARVGNAWKGIAGGGAGSWATELSQEGPFAVGGTRRHAHQRYIPVVPFTVTGLRIYPKFSATGCRLELWTGNANMNGNRIGREYVELDVVADQWNEVVLDTPYDVPIDDPDFHANIAVNFINGANDDCVYDISVADASFWIEAAPEVVEFGGGSYGNAGADTEPLSYWTNWSSSQGRIGLLDFAYIL